MSSVLKNWQRLTLPGLKTQYHQRWRLSRPSSGWDRVLNHRYNHQFIGTDDLSPEALRVGGQRMKVRKSRGCNPRYLQIRIKPFELLVPVSYARRRASTSGLST